MDPYTILEHYYPRDSLAGSFLYHHSEAVAKMAVTIGEKTGADVQFIREAALLHDIGIFKTKAHGIGCFGHAHYICHGILGEKILNDRGFPRHGAVCRTHVGVGITIHQIQTNQLPLPEIDMIPCTEEEKIIAYADKFFSKRHEWLTTAKPLHLVLEEIGKHGKEQIHQFMEWHHRYGSL